MRMEEQTEREREICKVHCSLPLIILQLWNMRTVWSWAYFRCVLPKLNMRDIISFDFVQNKTRICWRNLTILRVHKCKFRSTFSDLEPCHDLYISVPGVNQRWNLYDRLLKLCVERCSIIRISFERGCRKENDSRPGSKSQDPLLISYGN